MRQLMENVLEVFSIYRSPLCKHLTSSYVPLVTVDGAQILACMPLPRDQWIPIACLANNLHVIDNLSRPAGHTRPVNTNG